MSDPVAEKSDFLKTYMSSPSSLIHPDTLVGYAKWYGKVAEPITSAELSAIDIKSMTLTCTLKDGPNKVVVVKMHPPLVRHQDVKPRLLEMKALSQEGLGMIKSPQITSFQRPHQARVGVASIIWSVIPYGAFAPSNAPGGSLLLAPAHFMHSYISPQWFKIALAIIAGIHVLDSLYALSLCRKHRASFLVTIAYVFSTLFIGRPIWMDLEKHIQNMRIKSVMNQKVE
ncbi:hypothetical protein GGX14DRAFT_627690 [Mycena pura]|uniref:DUF2470 domain-containing protein n=1 Tax=Mycena pura TaxID=153505 RepID=A0AAD6YR00_9AGAR|nr:hypothetical protein GGX14DRAFT_627690 [Mycena pura]